MRHRISRRALIKAIGGLAASTVLGISMAERKKHLELAPVSVVETKEGYSDSGLVASIERSISNLEKRRRIFKRGDTVLIKPSLVEARDPRDYVTTHPMIVSGMIETLKMRGVGKIIIAEGSAHERDTARLLKKTGFTDVLKKWDVDFIDLNHSDVVKVPNPVGIKLKELYLPKILFSVDKIISVPKLKTHRWAGVTLSMKNLLGVVPGSVYGFPKNMLHWAGIPESIVDLNSIIRPHLSLIDGIIGMEGQGPLAGRPKHLNTLISGTDSLAVDSTATRIMGFEPLKFPQFVEAYRKGLGRMFEDEIELSGVAIEHVETRFEPPIQWKDWL